MIQILPCPACHQTTVLPEGVTLEATIECPHCQERFVIGELLTARFGSWLVVDDPARPHAVLTAPTAAAAATWLAGETPGAAREEASGNEIAGNEAAGSGLTVTKGKVVEEEEVKLQAAHRSAPAREKAKADWSKFEPITHEQFERMRRQSRSPLWSIVQVVLGGLAAIPISLLLVWHLIGTDVAGAGPLVGRYLPWIVPEKFRPYDGSMSEPLSASGPSASRPPAPGASGFRQFDDVQINAGNGRDVQAPPPEMGETHNEVDPSSPGKAPGAAPASPNGAPTGEQPMPPAEVTGAEAASPRTSDPSGSVPGSAEGWNIYALIQKSIADLEAWTQRAEGEAADRKELAQRVYGDLIALANSLEALPQENPALRTIRSEMQPIGRRVLLNADVQDLVRQGAEFWLRKHSSEERFPLALIVEIGQVEETSGTWRVEPTPESELLLGSTPLALEIPQVLAPALIPGQKLLLLGVVRFEPQAGAAPAAEAASESAPGGDAEENVLSALRPAPDRPVFSANYLYGLVGPSPEPTQTSRNGHD